MYVYVRQRDAYGTLFRGLAYVNSGDFYHVIVHLVCLVELIMVTESFA